MAFIFGDNVDFTQKQLLNAVAHGVTVDPSAPVEGQLWYRTDLDRLCYYDGTAVRRLAFRLDQLDPPTGDVSLNSHKITSLADPTVATDAVNKQYADGLLQGVSWKDSVRVATTAALTLASAVENGDTIDGVVLATGNRVLVKDQAAGAENGIYTVNASGPPTRSTDADSAADLQGALVSVDEGTANAGTLWNMSTDSVVVGTTALVWIKIGQLSDLVAGAGLTKTGNTVDVVAADGSITVAADSITVGNVPVAKGGTGGTTPLTGRAGLVAAGRYSVNLLGGSAQNVNHNLNSEGPVVQVTNTSTGDVVHVGVIRTTQDQVVVDLSLLSAAVTFNIHCVG